MSAQPYYHYVLADKYSELGSYLLSVDTEHRVHCAGLGPERATRMCPLGLLEQLGVRLALHSDFTMAPAQVRYHVLRVTCRVSRVSADHNTQPLVLAWCAVNRVTLETGRTNHPELCLSPYTAMRGGRGCAVSCHHPA